VIANRIALLIGLIALSASCGGDEPTASAVKPGAKKATKATPKAKGKTAQLDAYSQIMPDFRRKFTEADFRPDPNGDENRDPFRSFVIRQGSLTRDNKSASSIQPTDLCTMKNSRAPGYSVRDLRLIGIVLRGTRGTAQFRDPRGEGWIVKRGDCLGKEKATVQAIGVGSVTLEVMPEAPPNTEPPPPERRDIPLYPAELPPAEAEAAIEGGATSDSSAAAPSTGTAPPTPAPAPAPK
jgi:Tfp pilus assembly protein PilP